MKFYLLVDGARVVADRIDRPVVEFSVRLPVSEIRLISGCAAPSDLLGAADTRRLGIELRTLRWLREGETFEVPVDLPGFMDGFHLVEEREDGPVRWTTGNAALPLQAVPPWHGRATLQLSVGEWEGSALEPAGSVAAKVLDAFESLGEDCEFGLAQRSYLVEPPLTLYRWGGTTLPQLIHGLETGFAGLADPAETEIVWDGNEYFLRNPLVSMHTNCKVEQDARGCRELLDMGIATIRILRRVLLREIAEGSHIFVFKGRTSAFGLPQIYALHEALRRIGPASLLGVLKAPHSIDAGRAERLAEGLYVGYLDRFVIPDGPFHQWLDICSEALSLHKNG